MKFSIYSVVLVLLSTATMLSVHANVKVSQQIKTSSRLTINCSDQIIDSEMICSSPIITTKVQDKTLQLSENLLDKLDSSATNYDIIELGNKSVTYTCKQNLKTYKTQICINLESINTKRTKTAFLVEDLF